MTASFTPSCTSARNSGPVRGGAAQRVLARALLAILLLAGCVPAAVAGEIVAQRVELRGTDENLQPVADFSITLNPLVEQALTHGVPLYFTGEFSLIHHRWYWLNDVASQSETTVRLSYNALTRQYRVSYGAIYQNFNELGDALRLLGHQAFESFPAASLRAGVNYVLSARMHLELGQLPKPLQINALVNTDWEMDSGWRSWNLNLASAPDPSRPIQLDFK
jgi:Domain of unknown function (DUF4390)